ncbi:MAG TPA: hypothetical protein VFE60_21085 [Roseiarcus sp.]|nr:hypothetical protein [Roseiarcus sp.]
MSIFNKLHHICIVVHDLDRARAYFESVEIGPWIEYPRLPNIPISQFPTRTRS